MDQVLEYIMLMIDDALDKNDGDTAASLTTLRDMIELNLTDKGE